MSILNPSSTRLWSFPHETYVTSGGSLCHLCRPSLGWPGGDLSSVSSLVSAVPQSREDSGISHQLFSPWVGPRAFWGREDLG